MKFFIKVIMLCMFFAFSQKSKAQVVLLPVSPSNQTEAVDNLNVTAEPKKNSVDQLQDSTNTNQANAVQPVIFTPIIDPETMDRKP